MEPHPMQDANPDRVLAQWRERAARAQETGRLLAERTRSARVTERGAGGLVRVTLNGSGHLVGLELDDRLRDRAPAAIAGEVLRCAQAAQRSLADEIERRAHEILGDGPTMDRLRAELRPAPTPRHRVEDDSEESIMVRGYGR